MVKSYLEVGKVHNGVRSERNSQHAGRRFMRRISHYLKQVNWGHIKVAAVDMQKEITICML